jgi:hypothetical protein
VRHVSSRRYWMACIAGFTAVALAVTALPASATTMQSMATGQRSHPFKIRADDVEDAICLANSDHTCAGVLEDPSIPSNSDGVPVQDIITDVLGALGILVAIWIARSGKGGGKHEKVTDYGSTNPQDNGLCMGTTGRGQDVVFMSCNSPHGIYWQDQSVNGGYRIWNTLGGFLTAPTNRSGSPLFIWRTVHDWVTWNYYCYNCSERGLVTK